MRFKPFQSLFRSASMMLLLLNGEWKFERARACRYRNLAARCAVWINLCSSKKRNKYHERANERTRERKFKIFKLFFFIFHRRCMPQQISSLLLFRRVSSGKHRSCTRAESETGVSVGSEVCRCRFCLFIQ